MDDKKILIEDKLDLLNRFIEDFYKDNPILRDCFKNLEELSKYNENFLNWQQYLDPYEVTYSGNTKYEIF